MVFVSKERVKKLEKILAKYPDILSDDEIGVLVLKTFTFEKPLASIEFHDKKTEKIVKVIEELAHNKFLNFVKAKKEK